MTDLQFDSDTVASTGRTLQDAAWALSLNTDLELAGCGSAAVAAAADTWAMWAKASLLQVQSGTASAGTTATGAATSFEAQEQEITDAASGNGGGM